ncbi:MAG: tetratricopeptide repeat protein [Alphaproteobacteria bacterium]|nr:tetratricopeptide repeat protein [Alphaproteobacteria bacterium]
MTRTDEADPRRRAARLRQDARRALDARDFRAAAAALVPLVAAEPGDPDGHGLLAAVRAELGDLPGAAAAYAAGLRLRPGHRPTANLLGGLLLRMNAVDRALAVLEPVAAAATDDAALQATYAVALFRAERFADAEAAARRAIARDPGLVPAWINLGSARRLQGDNAGALAATETALRLAPDLPEAHFNRALALLCLGRFAEGWDEHDWYWRQPHTPPRPLPQPRWDGAPAAGTVALWGDQGVGDEIWASAFVPALLRAGHRLAIECAPRLVPLFARSFPGTTIVAAATPPDPRLTAPGIVAQAPLARLPALAWRRDGSATRPDERLVTDPVRTADLRARYRRLAGSRTVVGIAWRSRKPDGQRIEVPIDAWGPLLLRRDLFVVDLQYGDTEGDRIAAMARFGAHIHRDPEVDALADLDGFAAQVAAMDRVATAVNATVATALAVGVPPLVAVRAHQPDWRYPPAAAASPWLPGARLFRQSDPARWEDVMAAIAAAIPGPGQSPGGRASP